MEAEVIIARCIQEANSKIPMEILTNGAIIGLTEREQLLAEISFNEGIKEVVDWIKSHGDWDCGYFIFGFDIDQDIWNAKLKEWGITPD